MSPQYAPVGDSSQAFLVFYDLDTFDGFSGQLFCRRSFDLCLCDIYSWLDWVMHFGKNTTEVVFCAILTASHQDTDIDMFYY